MWTGLVEIENQSIAYDLVYGSVVYCIATNALRNLMNKR